MELICTISIVDDMRLEVCFARVAQLVEHDLAKVGVAGSSPVSRSLKKYGNVDRYSVSVIFMCLQI